MRSSILSEYRFGNISKKTIMLILLSCILVIAWRRNAIGIPQGAEHHDLSEFVGTWKGVCADKKPFVIVTLHEEKGQIVGSVSIGNMHGGLDGSCEEVVNPPAPEHAHGIHDVTVDGATLSFSWVNRHGQKTAEFQMKVIGSKQAEFRFLGTPTEENPWKLERE